MSSKNPHAPLKLSDIAGEAESKVVSSTPSYRAERVLVRKLLQVAGNPDVCMRLWDGQEIAVTPRPVATIHVTQRRSLYRLLMHGDVGFGDEYTAGRILIEGDLIEMLRTLYYAEQRVERSPNFFSRISKILARRPRLNSPEGSRENIYHHYDIGNEFYRLWLDKEMQYTCAYFPETDISIEAAQLAKMDHICRKLQLRPGDRVVEAGCGWGSLARHMAKYYGAKVTAYNISHEQVAFATSRARSEGLDDQLRYVEDDYRNIEGEFDAFVSIGMLEHVGKRNYAKLGAVVDRCLPKEGRGLIHTIGRNQAKLMNAWTEKRIFPGAYPPTLGEMMSIFEPFNFSVLDVENLRMHYARTLELWLERYDGAQTYVQEMFDEDFVRAWRLYLAGSVSAFLAGSLQLYQVVFARGTYNGVPWTRKHMYSPPNAL
jgi:cyclopropane-fatty-acyl-phospholipid synthase